MIVRKAATGDIVHVFANLAPERAAEACASSFHDDPRHLGHELMMLRQGSPPGHVALWALCDAEEPVAICGVIQFGPELAGMVWVATPRWRQGCVIATHRWWRKFFAREVLPIFRRVEFTSLASDLVSRRWLAWLGFTEEGIAYAQGKRGEDFVHMAWLNPSVRIARRTAAGICNAALQAAGGPHV